MEQHICNYVSVGYDGQTYVYTCADGCELYTTHGTIPLTVVV